MVEKSFVTNNNEIDRPIKLLPENGLYVDLS